jgi:hypothetical protein
LEHGFRKSFGVLENAALDTRKEAIDSAVEQYLEDISKKTLHEFPRDMNIPR